MEKESEAGYKVSLQNFAAFNGQVQKQSSEDSAINLKKHHRRNSKENNYDELIISHNGKNISQNHHMNSLVKEEVIPIGEANHSDDFHSSFNDSKTVFKPISRPNVETQMIRVHSRDDKNRKKKKEKEENFKKDKKHSSHTDQNQKMFLSQSIPKMQQHFETKQVFPENHKEEYQKKVKSNLNLRLNLSLKQRMTKHLQTDDIQMFEIISKGMFGDRVLIKDIESGNEVMVEQRLSSVFSKRSMIKLATSDSIGLIGRIQGNFQGSLFNIFEINQNELGSKLVATIVYDSTFKCSETPRLIDIYIQNPSPIIEEEKPSYAQNFMQFYQKNPSQKEIIKLTLQEPIFNMQKKTFSLPFKTKQKVLSSVHNCIFLENQSHPVIKLYQIQPDVYKLHVRDPISPMIAYSYVLTSFYWKWASQ